MKYTLHLNQSFPFASNVPIVELEAERILGNDIVLPGEHHPYNMRLWVIGNEYGALGAVWASNEQDALDELIDKDLGQALLVDESDQDKDTEYATAGNASEAIYSDHLWMAVVNFQAERDLAILLKFAELRGSNGDTLDDI